VKRILDTGSTHTSQSGNLVDRQVTKTALLNLAGDDTKHGAIALGVAVPHAVRQRA
jgi:hypothetical protein